MVGAFRARAREVGGEVMEKSEERREGVGNACKLKVV